MAVQDAVASRRHRPVVRAYSARPKSEPSPSAGPWKRVIDVAGAGLALAALAPVFAVVAVLIKRDGGPVFFGQTRVGRGGRTFRFYKFRSMVVDAEARRAELFGENERGGFTFKMRRDPRVTPIGRFLRRTSLDELPQLWNVLKGDMSLVGPRPALPSEVEMYTYEERARLAVTPGITCIWQVSGRADLPFDDQVRLDVEYIENRSLRLDIKLMLLTLPAMIHGRGAY